MRNTGPVTQVEVGLTENDQLVSATTPKGVITEANETFCRIAGFRRDELIGQAHNIVRHQDMPQAAFQLLWDTVEDGRPWRGIVKNRCKNGDHYWVDAYVTPCCENGKIVSYESVRQKPKKEWVERAETVYNNLNAGRNPLPWFPRVIEQNLIWLRPVGIGLLGLVAAIILAPQWGWLLGAVFFALAWALQSMNRVQPQINRYLQKFNDDAITQYIFTGHLTQSSRLQMLQSFHERHLHTVLERMNQQGDALKSLSVENHGRSQEQFGAISQAKDQLNGVASAVQEMSHSVQEIAANSTDSSNAAQHANEQAQQGLIELQEAGRQIQTLVHSMTETVEVVNQLAKDSEQIRTVISVISGIAEQTNLLALNAAIEAARAGEQGRGFAVVADEVRSLASKTQDSTETISNIINTLISATEKTVTSIDQGNQMTSQTQSRIDAVQQYIHDLADAIHRVTENIETIADLSGQQALASDEISKNSEAVLGLTEDLSESAEQTLQFSDTLTEQADKQAILIKRFR